MDLTAKATAAIITFHQQIEKWFRAEGVEKKNGTAFLLEDFHADFIMISPNGISRNLDDLVSWLPTAYGARPAVVVDVKNIIRRFEQQGAVLMEYEETQRTGDQLNRRISSALFVQEPDGRVLWQHLQETFLI
jgi:hypothetical protein